MFNHFINEVSFFILLRLFKELLLIYYINVVKFVCFSYSVIVEKVGCGDLFGIGVISKDNELVFVTFVSNLDEIFLDIRYNYFVINCLDFRYVIGNMLGKNKNSNLCDF